MLNVLFDQQGVVHREFVVQGQTVNTEFYCLGLRNRVPRIREKICNNWILQHDNSVIVSELTPRIKRTLKLLGQNLYKGMKKGKCDIPSECK